MIDLSKKCNLYKCTVCLHKEACWNGAFSYNNDFELACPEEIKTRLNEEDYTMSQKSLMLDILERYITDKIVVAEKEKEPIDKEKEKETKTYEQGLEDAWEIARKIITWCDGSFNLYNLREIFNEELIEPASILASYPSIHEVKAKIDAWAAEKNKPKLGDVVEIDDRGKFLYLGESTEYCYVLDPYDKDTEPHKFDKKYTKSIKKTGKHFDIRGMLDGMKTPNY